MIGQNESKSFYPKVVIMLSQITNSRNLTVKMLIILILFRLTSIFTNMSEEGWGRVEGETPFQENSNSQEELIEKIKKEDLLFGQLLQSCDIKDVGHYETDLYPVYLMIKK